MFQFERLFSAEEADELIPRLEIVMGELQLKAGFIRQQLSELCSAEPELAALDLAQAIERHPELRQTAARMAELAGHIEEMGCLLKDIDQGLVDFPCEIDGEVALLCWQFGEPLVVAWHRLEDGFAGRRPLPGGRKIYLN